jgi:hypothetical protein
MRAVTVLGVLVVGAAGTVSAQHAHQLEFGGYGTFTRYDQAFLLDNQFGGGGRLGFFFNDVFGIEVDGNVTYPNLKNGPSPTPPNIDHTQVRIGSLSLVLNSGGNKSVLYLLGGYSRIDMGVNPPYNFALNAVHGGIGERFFIGNHMALRLEARAYYAPKNCCLSGQNVFHAQGQAGLSFFLGSGGVPEEKVPEIPKAKRDSILAAGGQVPKPPRRGGPSYEQRETDWQHKWYWGGEAGLFVFRTNFDSYAFEPTFGGHWLITAKKTALYASYEQSFFLSPRHATIVEPRGAVNPGNVSFNNLRRIMVGVLAFPAQMRVEPFAGGGFAIMEALNIQTSCSAQGCASQGDVATLQTAAEDAGTKAFFWWMGGVDIKQGRLALYGHYILTSAAANFLIQGTTHTFQGGLRYSLGSSKEGITDRQ